MGAEDAMILDLDYIVLIFCVLLLQMLQDVQFDTSLMLVALFVLYDFDSYNFSCFMIHAFECLAETTLANEV